MKLSLLAALTSALVLSSAAVAQIQSGTGIGARGPSTGTSADTAGATGTTAPRGPALPETSVGTSGAYWQSAPVRSSGLCDQLTGEERARCLREQAAAGTQGGPAGAGGTVPETSVGTSGAYAAPLPDRSSGLCDQLIGDERARCLREQAATR